MRISDWSSDVCSSDLPRHPLLHKGAGGRYTPLGKAESHWTANHARRKCRFRASHRIGRDAGGYDRSKIGRASCRERVLSVRVDLGGRRIIKKKKATAIIKLS